MHYIISVSKTIKQQEVSPNETHIFMVIFRTDNKKGVGL
jgi:hypothetical protein